MSKTRLKRVYYKHGAYYYVTLQYKWIRIGETLREAYDWYFKNIEPPAKIFTMGDLFDRYMIEVATKKAKNTYEDNKKEIRQLNKVFAKMAPEDIEPHHIYKYMRKRAEKAKVRPNREKALLSCVFNFAIELGLLKQNPCKEVKRLTERPRRRYVQMWELAAVYRESPPILRCIIRFAYLTGQRISDVLAVCEKDINDEGIFFLPSKTRNSTQESVVIEWTGKLSACVNQARHLRVIRSLYLFSKKSGRRYTYGGFRSMWRRAVQAAIDKGTLKEKFRFHDIRAKTYSDEKDPRIKMMRAAHSSMAMGRNYDRGERKVPALK